MNLTARSFSRLRQELAKYGVSQKEIASVIHHSQSYVTYRMSCEKPWSLIDIQRICEYLHIPESETYLYFPPSEVKYCK